MVNRSHRFAWIRNRLRRQPERETHLAFPALAHGTPYSLCVRGSVKRRGRRERRGRAEQRRAVDREVASLTPKDSPRPPRTLRFHSGPLPARKLPPWPREHVRPRDDAGPSPDSPGSGAATACMARAENHPIKRRLSFARGELRHFVGRTSSSVRVEDTEERRTRTSVLRLNLARVKYGERSSGAITKCVSHSSGLTQSVALRSSESVVDIRLRPTVVMPTRPRIDTVLRLLSTAAFGK